MVAVKDNPFTKQEGDESRSLDSFAFVSGPLTPTASDCFSQCSDTDGSTAAVVTLTAQPARRDPAQLIDRLENAINSSRKRLGKRKRRMAINDAALAALVEGYEEDPRLHATPYHSAFTQLLESPVNMMVWNHFTNLSEEEQKRYLAGPKVRSQLQLCKEESLANGINKLMIRGKEGRAPIHDNRSLHPAAMPGQHPGYLAIKKTPEKKDQETYRRYSPRSLVEPLLQAGQQRHHFAPNILPSSTSDTTAADITTSTGCKGPVVPVQSNIIIGPQQAREVLLAEATQTAASVEPGDSPSAADQLPCSGCSIVDMCKSVDTISSLERSIEIMDGSLSDFEKSIEIFPELGSQPPLVVTKAGNAESATAVGTERRSSTPTLDLLDISSSSSFEIIDTSDADQLIEEE